MPRVPAFTTFGMLAMALISGRTVIAQMPVAPPTQPAAPAPADWDKLVVDALKEAHNKGADLYNGGDAAGGFRLYQGALTVVRPLLGHRPAIQKVIDDGLTDVGKSNGAVKIQAFRLHEVIEQVRYELKQAMKREVRAAEASRAESTAETERLPQQQPMPAPAAHQEPDQPTRPMERPAADPPTKPVPATPGGMVGGVVLAVGAPAVGAEVTFVSLGTPEPRVFMATVTETGLYALDAAIPPGEYAVMVSTGKGLSKVPEKYQSVLTSGLTATVASGPNALHFDLK